MVARENGARTACVRPSKAGSERIGVGAERFTDKNHRPAFVQSTPLHDFSRRVLKPIWRYSPNGGAERVIIA
jgi:hypothetical protein